jgi:hypothetical protein
LIHRPSRVVVLAVVLAAAGAGCQRACGGLGGRPPAPLPEVKGAGGERYKVLDKGAYKAYYDTLGQLVRIEHDEDGDGRADRIVHYEGGKVVTRVELDLDHDGWVDRVDYYDAAGKLVKIGQTKKQNGKVDTWTYSGPDGLPVRIEHDDNGDMVVDRAEILRAGQVVGVEVDADGDGRIDRWQAWSKGHLVSEDLDTDKDGRPDRRLVYDARGRITASQPIAVATPAATGK